MPSCSSCGSYVSAGLIKVYGNNDGKIYGCLDCSTLGELREGNAVEPSE